MLMTVKNNNTLIPSESPIAKKRRRIETQDNNNNENVLVLVNSPLAERNSMIAPDFNCVSVFQNQIQRIQLSNLLVRTKAVVLFFYECDFTPSACKDLLHIQNNCERFDSLNSKALAISMDTEMVHSAFLSQSDSLGFTPSFPLVADTTRSVSHYFSVINPETGLARRAVFIIDSARQVRFSFILEDDRISHSMNTICNIVTYKEHVDEILALANSFYNIASNYHLERHI